MQAGTLQFEGNASTLVTMTHGLSERLNGRTQLKFPYPECELEYILDQWFNLVE